MWPVVILGDVYSRKTTVPCLVQWAGRSAYDSWCVLQSQLSTVHSFYLELEVCVWVGDSVVEVRFVMNQQDLEVSKRCLPELEARMFSLFLDSPL